MGDLLAGAVYQGGGRRRSKGHGVLGLTDRRVLFMPIAGEQLSVPRVRITGARLEERRRRCRGRRDGRCPPGTANTWS